MAVLFAVVFMAIGAISHGFTLRAHLFYGMAGAFFGLIGAPEWEPKSFKYPTLWQIGFSIVPCILLAYRSGTSPEGYALAVAVGVIIGLTAPTWVHHLPSTSL